MSERWVLSDGVVFELDRVSSRLILTSDNEQLTICNHKQIKDDPLAWYESLQILVRAVQHGPSSAITWLNNQRQPDLGGSLCCNVCGETFIVNKNAFLFTAAANGKVYRDIQCSQICHKQRKLNFYKEHSDDKLLNLVQGKHIDA